MRRRRQTARALGVLGHGFTALRVVISPLVYVWIVAGESTLAAAAVACAMASDLIDGALVRRFGRPTRAGAWFDIHADLLLILCAFAGFAAAGILSGWLLAPISASFAVFVATATLRARLYDPIGRCIGGILMAAALAVCLATDALVQQAIGATAALACLLTIVARLASVLPGRQGQP